jgi:hypothetical protein
MGTITLGGAVGCKKTQKPDAQAAAAGSASAQRNSAAFPLPDEMLGGLLGGDAGTAEDLLAAAMAAADGGGLGAPPEAVVDEPGAEPRSPLQYAFAVGKAETVVATTRTSVQESSGTEAPTGGEMPPIKLTLSVRAAEAQPESRMRFEAKVLKAELDTRNLVPLGAPQAKEMAAQVAAQSDAMTKTLATLSTRFVVTKTGAVGDMQLGGDPQTQMRVAEFLPVLQEAIQLLFVLVPSAPVGVGATWSTRAQAALGGTLGTITARYTLKERSASGAVIEMATERSAPRQLVRDPQAPPGTAMEMGGKGNYMVTTRWAGIAAKAAGATESRIVVTDPSMQPPRSSVTLIKTLQSVDAK